MGKRDLKVGDVVALNKKTLQWYQVKNQKYCIITIDNSELPSNNYDPRKIILFPKYLILINLPLGINYAWIWDSDIDWRFSP